MRGFSVAVCTLVQYSKVVHVYCTTIAGAETCDMASGLVLSNLLLFPCCYPIVTLLVYVRVSPTPLLSLSPQASYSQTCQG